jgi:putative hydroxymethylpyrimidine transport system substrate-binding protein
MIMFQSPSYRLLRRPRRVRLAPFALSLVLAAVVVGVGAPEAARQPAVKQTRQLTKITVTAEFILWAAHLPVIVALQNGYYKDAGLDVNFIPPASANDPIRVVQTGRAVIGLSQTPSIVVARAEGLRVKIIARLVDANPIGLVSLPSEQIHTPRDLIGKTVAVYNTADSIGAFHTMLQKSKITPAEERRIGVVDPGYAGLTLLFKHKVAALWAVIGYETSIVRATTHAAPNFLRATDYGVPNYDSIVFFSTDNYIAHHADVVQAFVQATRRGVQEMLAHPALVSRAKAYLEKADPAFGTRAAWDAAVPDTLPFFSPNLATNVPLLKQTLQWMTTVLVKGKHWLPQTKIQPLSNYYTNQFATGS